MLKVFRKFQQVFCFINYPGPKYSAPMLGQYAHALCESSYSVRGSNLCSLYEVQKTMTIEQDKLFYGFFHLHLTGLFNNDSPFVGHRSRYRKQPNGTSSLLQKEAPVSMFFPCLMYCICRPSDRKRSFHPPG